MRRLLTVARLAECNSAIRQIANLRYNTSSATAPLYHKDFMMKFILILIVGLILEAVGVVLLSQGLHEIGEVKRISGSEIARVVGRGATNGHILLGVAFEAAFFGVLLYLLSQRDVSLIWPLTSLGFVITAIAAKFIRHEEITALRWGGVALIVAGAMLVALSEKQKKEVPPASDVVSTTAATQ
jgi:drug/metabolite transporter (DMT)-like permease